MGYTKPYVTQENCDHQGSGPCSQCCPCRTCGSMRGRDTYVCEHRPYPGAGYHCLLEAGHEKKGIPHSDLTLLWNDAGEQVNLDGSPI